MSRIRLGVVGLGTVAQACHLPIVDRLRDQFELAAVADLSATLRTALGERYRVEPRARFETGAELIEAGGADAILVLTSGSHAALCVEALRAGLPVFVEKPLAYTLREIDAIDEAIAANDGRLELGYMKLWDPAVVRAREAIDARRSRDGGRLRSAEVVVLHPPSGPQLAHARLLPPPADVQPDRLATLLAGSRTLARTALGDVPDWLLGLYTDVLLGSVVHELALVRAFATDPVAIDHADAWSDGAWPPSVSLEGRLAGGARLSIRWHYLPHYPAYREVLRLIYEDGSIELEFPAPYLLNAPTALTIVDSERGERRDTSFTSYREAFEEELLAFHALVTDGTRPAAGASEGRADVVTCQRIAGRLSEAIGAPIGGEAARTGVADAAADRTPVGAAQRQSSWTTRPS
jgi:predicted dehydrogenase